MKLQQLREELAELILEIDRLKIIENNYCEGLSERRGALKKIKLLKEYIEIVEPKLQGIEEVAYMKAIINELDALENHRYYGEENYADRKPESDS